MTQAVIPEDTCDTWHTCLAISVITVIYIMLITLGMLLENYVESKTWGYEENAFWPFA